MNSHVRSLLERLQQMRSQPGEPVGRVSRIGAPLVLFGGLVFFLGFVGGHVAIGDWLFWDYARYWILALGWALACTAFGQWSLDRILPRPLPLAERIAMGFALGVFAFFLAMFLGGLLGLYGSVFFYALPLAFLAIGGPSLGRRLLRFRRHARALGTARRPPAWAFVAFAFGVLVLAAIYFVILTPANVSFDARWKHLAIAEQYVELGRVAPFVEGWYPGTAPHLVSFIYAWAFMVPGKALPDQLGLAAHVEFVTFLVGLVGIPALVRRMLPHAPARLSWVVRLLFPGILVYDSTLSVGADHIAAVFSIPIFLGLLYVWKDLSPRASIVLVVMLSGGVLAKYSSAVSVFLFPVVAVLLRAGLLAWKRWRTGAFTGHWLAGPAVAFVAGLALTAPHWLKNWIWYGDPFYPVLHRLFDGRPWDPEIATVFQYGYLAQTWSPPKTWEGLLAALKVMFTFSFVPHNWGNFHGKLPVFGSLFTLTFTALPFLRANRRVWALFAMCHVGVFSWYWIHHQDRHLQALVPLMAAATAAAFVLIWRLGKAAQVALVGLILAQVIWTADVYFFPTHAMARSPIKASIDLVASTFRKERDEQRIRSFEQAAAVREALPDDAVLLLHDIHLHAGIGAPSISDHQGWQAGINYGALRTPGAIWDHLRQLGATHVLYKPDHSRGWDSLAGDVAARHFFDRHLVDRKDMPGRFVLARLPDRRPDDEGPERVYLHTCKARWKSGMYDLETLRLPAFGPRRKAWPAPVAVPADDEERTRLVREADYVFLEQGCKGLGPARLGFSRIATRATRGNNKFAHDPRKLKWELWRSATMAGRGTREQRPGASPIDVRLQRRLPEGIGDALRGR